jgi:uncharacterized protein (DUF2235 family)
MPKNIVICCDGTANEFAKNNTNVVKLYSALRRNPATQVTYYHPGLGTMEPVGALTTWARKVTKVLGMAFGHGLANDIRDAYVFLMKHYEPEDKAFLFGFSRGAYTVRAVASLLHVYGLAQPGNEALVPYIIRMMLGIQRATDSTDSTADGRRAVNVYFTLAQDFKRMMARTDCKPWFVGVWDTVSFVGWVENPLKLPYVTSNPDIEIGRHAIAIDERRAFFRSHLWRTPADKSQPHGPKDLKQVWFPGVHCASAEDIPSRRAVWPTWHLSGCLTRRRKWAWRWTQFGVARSLDRRAEIVTSGRTRRRWHMSRLKVPGTSPNTCRRNTSTGKPERRSDA